MQPRVIEEQKQPAPAADDDLEIQVAVNSDQQEVIIFESQAGGDDDDDGPEMINLDTENSVGSFASPARLNPAQ